LYVIKTLHLSQELWQILITPINYVLLPSGQAQQASHCSEPSPDYSHSSYMNVDNLPTLNH